VFYFGKGAFLGIAREMLVDSDFRYLRSLMYLMLRPEKTGFNLRLLGDEGPPEGPQNNQQAAIASIKTAVERHFAVDWTAKSVVVTRKLAASKLRDDRRKVVEEKLVEIMALAGIVDDWLLVVPKALKHHEAIDDFREDTGEETWTLGTALRRRIECAVVANSQVPKSELSDLAVAINVRAHEFGFVARMWDDHLFLTPLDSWRHR